MGIKLALNSNKRDNYEFIDLEAPLFLDQLHPKGESPRLTASILRAVAGETLIDIDGVIDIHMESLKDKPSNMALKTSLGQI